MKPTGILTATAALALAALACLPVHAQGAAELRARHDTLAPQLASSPFGRPLVLESNTSTSEPQGDVYAIVPHAFRTVQGALQRAGAWCDVLMLQFNVKRCVPSDGAPGPMLQVAVGRKSDEPVERAHPIAFRFAVRAARPDYLSVQMAADAGPLGTSDYQLAFVAVPIDARRTFVHLSYSYAAGLAARLATEAYLATSGRDKVGFSTVERDAAGAARQVSGMRGVAERNTMRYFLAVEAYLDALAAPAGERIETRLRRWFAATERHPRQLHEMDLDQYLAMKRRELRLPRAAGGAG